MQRNKTNNLQKPKEKLLLKLNSNKQELKEIPNSLNQIPSGATNNNPQKHLKLSNLEKKDRYYLTGNLNSKNGYIIGQRKAASKQTSKASISNLLRVNTEQSVLKCNHELNLNYKRRLDRPNMPFAKKRKSALPVQEISRLQKQQEQVSTIRQADRNGQNQAKNEMIRKLNERINSILNETEKLGKSLGEESSNQQYQEQYKDLEMVKLEKTVSLLEMRILSFCKSAGKISEDCSALDENKYEKQYQHDLQQKNSEQQGQNIQLVHDKQL